jgi:hypothetical protein
MIEGYAFLAAFTVQILAVSVLYPLWLIRCVRARAAIVPTERLEQLYPGVDFSRALERFLNPYRAVNTVIAVLGLLMLGWLFNLVRRPDWDKGFVELLTTAYFMVQMLPLCVMGVLGVIYMKAFKHSSQEGKRKASLQRRGLFDFVSPFVVVVALLVYILFVTFVIYLGEHPFPGFGGLVNIGAITLVYALNAFVIYKKLYGTKNPLETNEGRAHTIGLTVKLSVYSCIATTVFVSLIFGLALLELKSWEPFALSVFFVITVLQCSMGLTAPPREPRGSHTRLRQAS